MCPSHPDAVRKLFIQLAHSSFPGFPNLIKTAKVADDRPFDSLSSTRLDSLLLSISVGDIWFM